MRYDIIVIGSGPGGYEAAVRGTQLGKRVAVVERNELGGTCVNWGCIPTKALLRSAHVYADCRNAASFGVAVSGEALPDLEKMVARSRTVATNMSKGVAMLLNKSGVDVITGFGKLTSAHTVDVDGTEYEAENIILATGARPREMPFLPVDHENVLNSKDALALTALPESIAVVGSGAIGSEFATLYASLGAKVILIEYMPQIMPLEDEETARTAERAFRKLRATVLTATTVKGVSVTDAGCELSIVDKSGNEKSITAQKVLAAVGIKSNIEGIGLEEVGVVVERDKVVVNENYATTVEGVYAIGDIIATPALAHVASAEALYCVEHICGLSPKPIDYTATPSCIFSSPEVASVGMTEREATSKGIAYTVGRYQYAASGKAMAMGERDGFVKLLFDDKRCLVGAHMIGAGVSDMLGEACVAIAEKVTAERLATVVHAHPTMNEAIREAAADACRAMGK